MSEPVRCAYTIPCPDVPRVPQTYFIDLVTNLSVEAQTMLLVCSRAERPTPIPIPAAAGGRCLASWCHSVLRVMVSQYRDAALSCHRGFGVVVRPVVGFVFS